MIESKNRKKEIGTKRQRQTERQEKRGTERKERQQKWLKRGNTLRKRYTHKQRERVCVCV